MNESLPAIPSCPMESVPGLWRGDELIQRDDWVFRFPGEALAEIEAALRAVQAKGLTPPSFAKNDFPLPGLSKVLRGMLDELESGRGFFLMRGFPIERFSEAEAEIVFWGLGLHLGTALSQNADGHLVGHVRNLGVSIHKTNVRAYQTTAELIFHNDQSDVLMLMCLKAAKAGGLSRIATVTGIQNEIQRRRPDLLEELYRPFYIDRRGERGREDEDELPYYAMPVLSYHNGLVTARYIRGYIESAQRFPEVPRLTAKQVEALDLFDAVANDKRNSISFQMEPGDFQLVNNYSVLHARTNFEDFDDPAQRRHLLRLWLATPNSRDLPPCFEKRFGTCKGGYVRGGIPPSRRVQASDKVEDFRLERV